jgi:protein-glutamine gamma-glutamyltransferase
MLAAAEGFYNHGSVTPRCNGTGAADGRSTLGAEPIFAMPLDRVLQLHTLALVILGAVFVGQGPDAALVPSLAALSAIAAFTLTDVLGRLKLNRWMANLIVIAAVLWSLREFFEIASEEKLVAIANMLCYMQIVLLFQEKDLRVYWQLFVLSVLQVVVAAALDLGPQFALLLSVYALVALSTLLLLCMYRELGSATGRRVLRALPATKSPLLAPPEVLSGGLTARDLRRGLPAAILLRQVMLFSLVTLIFSIAFFYATPRMSENSWLAANSRGAGGVGFQPEVRLAQRGRIHLSNQLVMRVQLSRMSDRRPVMLVGEPYLHGETLTDYRHDERGARWLPWRPLLAAGVSGGRSRYASTASQSNVSMVRQDIVLEATNSSRRFAIQPNQPLSDYPSVGYGWPRGSESEGYVVPRHRRYSYATPAIAGGRQLRANPNPNRLMSPTDGAAYGEEEQATLALDVDRFPGLVATAAQIIQEHKLDGEKLLDKALALEQHFLVPGRYQYSLNLNVARKSELDPIEDFLMNHRTGHCEYFASALVLMLRSQGIPARMVLGYKGGSFNSVGQYYVVQQRHAHSWVEAWVPSSDVLPGELAGTPSDGGAWYRLDPTPGRETFIALNEQQGIGNRIAQAFDYVELLWRDYVLSLNRNRQEDIVYDPLAARMNMVPSWVESRRLRLWLKQLSNDLGLDFVAGPRRSNRRAFEPGLALLVITLLLTLIGLVAGLRTAARAVKRWLHVRNLSIRSQAPPFYRRLELLLARLPAVRRTGQTPRELAGIACQRLTADGLEAAAALPADIVETYYRVRFGDGRLDKTETQAIEQSLCELADAIARR